MTTDVAAWIEEHWSPDLTLAAWWDLLYDAGLAFPEWPAGLGGSGASGREARAVAAALGAAGVVAPPEGPGPNMGGPTVLEHGTDEQRARFVEPLGRGRTQWCQLFSEPGAGSDLASLACRGELDGDAWVVSGQKVWSSRADTSDWGMLLFRTDLDVPKHRGITYALVALDQPGVEVRPLVQMNGAAEFSEVFLTEARVPVDQVIGPPGGGWAVARTTLAHERASTAAPPARGTVSAAAGPRGGNLDRRVGELVDRATGSPRRRPAALLGARDLLDLARRCGAADRPVLRDRLVRHHVGQEVYRLNGRRARDLARAGAPVALDGSALKLQLAALAHEFATSPWRCWARAGSSWAPTPPRAGGWRASPSRRSCRRSAGAPTRSSARSSASAPSASPGSPPSTPTCRSATCVAARVATTAGGQPMTWGMRWPGPDVGRRAEAAGCAAFCTGEFADGNAYVSLAEMAAHTTTARVGTGVAYAFARSPFVHGSALRHVDKIAPGRTFCGLGAGTRRMNEQWFGVAADRPLARMADLVGALRAFLTAPNGRPVRYAGELYDIDATIAAPVLGPIEVPILVGAFNEGMLRVAGRVADGVIGHGLFTDRWWDEVVDPNLAAGAAAGDRDPGALARWGWVITAVDDDDPARAERDARLMVGFYVTVKTYDALMSLHGWDDGVAAVREAFRARDFDAMAAAVPADMLDAIAVHGTAADARDRLAARRRLPDLRFHSVPSFLVSPRRAGAYAEAIVDLLAEPGAPTTATDGGEHP